MSTVASQKLLHAVDAENVNYYRPGGFHPVHLGDTFKNGRYQVIHKLGYGSYSTVWLVQDTISNRYSSLKVLAAEASNSDSEMTVIQHLQRHATGSGKEYVVEVFDMFEHSGPNGVHHCIVTEVLGPNIASDTEILYPGEIFPIDVAKRISAQVAQGLAYIHKAGIVHGDLHKGNILLHSPTIGSWSSQSDFGKYLGVPVQVQLRVQGTRELAAPSPHIPSYVVPLGNPDPLLQLCLSDPTQVHVKICDFSEAFIPDMQPNPRPRNTPVVYAAPEIIFGDTSGQPADIWALASLLHALISSKGTLFYSYHGIRKEVIRAMVWKLGKLPEKWWSSWEERGESFDEDGKWVGDSKALYYPGYEYDKLLHMLEDCLDKTELAAYEEITRRMVRYDPGQRASIDEVIMWMSQNAWFSR